MEEGRCSIVCSVQRTHGDEINAPTVTCLPQGNIDVPVMNSFMSWSRKRKERRIDAASLEELPGSRGAESV